MRKKYGNGGKTLTPAQKKLPDALKKKIPAGKKGKGIKALKKKAPQVAKAMGYKKGGKV